MSEFKGLEIGGGYGPHYPSYEQLDIDGDKIKYKWNAGEAQWPVPENHFDVVYAAHLIEHLYEAEAITFVKQAYRALKPGGRIQIATPDFEKICFKYIETRDMLWQFGKAYGHNGDSILEQLYGNSSIEKNRLTHHTLFDKRLMQRLLITAGFKDMVFFDVNPRYQDPEFIKLFDERVYLIRKQSEFYVEAIKP